MIAYDQRASKLLAIVRAAGSHARDTQRPELAETLDAIATQFGQARFPVVVCGEFKRGKSSLIGALLADTELCPIEIDVATNVVTSIEYGSPERIDVRDDGGATRIGRDAIAEIVTERGNPGNRRGALSVSIATPNRRLQNGLVLYDTPGIGGINVAHSALTYALLPTAVAAIFVADATEPLSASELTFAAKALSHVERVLVVLTRSDLVSDTDAIVADNKAKLAPLLGTKPDAVEVIAVSNLSYLDYLATADPIDLEASNFTALETALRSLVERDRARLLLDRTAAQTRDALERLQAPLRMERAACADTSKVALEEIEARLADSDARLQRLAGESAEWRRALARRLEDAKLDANETLIVAWGRLEDTFNYEYINDPAMLGAPDKLASALTRDIALVLGAMEKRLGAIADDICETIAESSGLTLERGEVASLSIDAVATAKSTGAQTDRTPFDRRVLLMRNAAGGAMQGAGAITMPAAIFLGATLANPLVAIPAAGVAAVWAIHSLRSTTAQLRKEDLRALQDDARAMGRPYLTEARSRATTQLTRAIRNLERTLATAFDDQLRDEQAVVTASRKALAATRGRSKTEAAARVAELDTLLAPIARLQDALTSLVSTHVPAPDLSWADA